jgi:hypothetical protein
MRKPVRHRLLMHVWRRELSRLSYKDIHGDLALRLRLDWKPRNREAAHSG